MADPWVHFREGQTNCCKIMSKKIFGRKKVLNCDSDNISVLSLGAESTAATLGLKKMSVISGGSLESLARPESRTRGEIVGKLK